VEQAQGQNREPEIPRSAGERLVQEPPLARSSIVTFRSAQYPQAAEIAAAPTLESSLPYCGRPIEAGPRNIERCAQTIPGRTRDPARESAPVGTPRRLDHGRAGIGPEPRPEPDVAGRLPLQILSSDAWNEGVEGRWKGKNNREAILPNASSWRRHFRHQEDIHPRSFEVKASEPGRVRGDRADAGRRQAHRTHPEDVKRYSASTRGSSSTSSRETMEQTG